MSNLSKKSFNLRVTEEVASKIYADQIRTGLTPTEVIREAIYQHYDSPNLELMIRQLEIRMLGSIFEICSSIVDITEDEKKEAKIECNKSFGQEVL
jgi:hypothetical protein